MKKTIFIPCFFIGLLLLTGCYYDKEENLYQNIGGTGNCDTTGATYTLKIKNILDLYCVNACHNPTTLSGGVDLSTFPNAKDYSLNGNLLCDVKQTCNPMPKGGKLSDCNVKLIEVWINANCPQ